MKLKMLFDKNQISEKIEDIGSKITYSYLNKDLIIIGILNGGFVFLSDLIRKIDSLIKLDFVHLSSYKGTKNSSGIVEILMDIKIDVKGKEVLIVDDILDTGESLYMLKEYISLKEPSSIKICTLIDKTERRKVLINPDFYGFKINGGFVVGYGLDYNEIYRNLPDIYILED